jgi:hypothetical protein
MRNAARWPDNDLVFTTHLGTPLDAANVRRAFRQVAEDAGLRAEDLHHGSGGTVPPHRGQYSVAVDNLFHAMVA